MSKKFDNQFGVISALLIFSSIEPNGSMAVSSVTPIFQTIKHLLKNPTADFVPMIKMKVDEIETLSDEEKKQLLNWVDEKFDISKTPDFLVDRLDSILDHLQQQGSKSTRKENDLYIDTVKQIEAKRHQLKLSDAEVLPRPLNKADHYALGLLYAFFQARENGYETLEALAAYLNSYGYRTPRGNDYSVSTANDLRKRLKRISESYGVFTIE